MSTQTELTEEQEAENGARIAQILRLRRDREHADRWQTMWGTKTNKGLCRMFLRMAEEIGTHTLRLDA